MKKLIIGMSAVAAAVVVGVPYLTGKVAEDKSKELVDQINASASHLGTVEVLDYQRGFRSSTSDYKYRFSKPYQELTKLEEIEYSCDIGHGINSEFLINFTES